MLKNKLSKNLIIYIKEGNYALARKTLKEWNNDFAAGVLEDETEENKYEFYIVISMIVNALEENGIEQNRIIRIYQELMRDLHTIQTKEEFEHFTVKTVDRVIVFFQKPEKESGYSPLIRQVLMEVDRDLMPKLTLQYFARRLNVNHTYLSDLFKRETGVTLTEYVTDKRIKRAQELLKNSEISVKNIAKQIGIEDVQYFGRLFKKRVGMTPTQFRQLNI